MSKPGFRQTRIISGREARRMGEREATREQRQRDIDRFWALSPEERARRIADNEAFQRIQKNGITLEDLKRAEDEAYHKGVRNGIESTMKTCYAAVCLAMHELHGFGRKRCARVLNRVDETIQMALTSQDAIDEVYDTMKLKIDFRETIPGERVQEA